MDEDTLRAAISAVYNHPGYNHVTFVAHGGEPLQTGRKFFDQYLRIQEELRPPHIRVKNSIQSNGSLVTPQWLDYLDAHDIEIGFSLDGPAELHDVNRPSLNGKPTLPRVERAVRRLKERGRHVNLIAVVSRETLRLGATAFHDYFAALEPDSLSLIPVQAEPAKLARYTTDDYVDWDEALTDFFIELIDRWFYSGAKQFVIRELHAIVSGLTAGQAFTCEWAADCTGGYFGIDVNGDVYPCGRFATPDFRYGNVHDSTWDDILKSKEMIQFSARQLRYAEENSGCPYHSVCNGGCPVEPFARERTRSGRPNTCCGRHRLIKHVETTMVNAGLLARPLSTASCT